MAKSKKAAEKSSSKTTASKNAGAKKTSPKKKAAKLESVEFMSQATAVKKKAEVEVAGYKFQAVPSGFNKELIADNQLKRFHGSRMLFSWLPQEFADNNKDHFGYMFPDLPGETPFFPIPRLSEI